MRFRAVVVGGGLAGLFTASELLAAGVDDLAVFDRDRAPGGVARTIQRDGFTIEPAAGSLLLPHPHLSPLLARLGVELEPAVAAGTRYVWTGGRLVPLPGSPQALLAPLLPWPAKLRALAEAVVRSRPPGGDESLDGFMRRRFGRRAGEALAWLAAGGVYAGDPARLAARAAFPRLVELEDRAGSVIRGGLRRLRDRPAPAPRPAAHLPVGGMAAVADAAAARLDGRWLAGTEVHGVRWDGRDWHVAGDLPCAADHVVLACGPPAAGRLLGGDLGRLLDQAAAAPVVVVGLGGRAAAVPLPAGFGALTARAARTATRGVLFESSYAPRRAPAGQALVRAIAGGATRPDVVEWDDARIVAEVGAEVAGILGVEAAWAFTEVVRHRPGIPQYEVGHLDWLAAVDRHVAALPGLHLTGWGYRGVGVAHVAADAARVAAAIAGN